MFDAIPFNAVAIIDILFAAIAAVCGLISRSIVPALIAGIWIGIVHGGLVFLAGLQSGSFALAELPYLKDVVDFTTNTAPFELLRPRYLAYLVACGIALLLIVMCAWCVRALFVAMGLVPQNRIVPPAPKDA